MSEMIFPVSHERLNEIKESIHALFDEQNITQTVVCFHEDDLLTSSLGAYKEAHKIVICEGDKLELVLCKWPESALGLSMIRLDQPYFEDQLRTAFTLLARGNISSLPIHSMKEYCDAQDFTASAVKEMEAVLSTKVLTTFEFFMVEMLSNAFFNAPVDAKGTHTSAHLKRTMNVSCDEDHPVQCRYGLEGDILTIEVTDPYGSFTQHSFVKYMNKYIDDGKSKFVFKPGGAGIGLFMMIKKCHFFHIAVTPGKSTRFTIRYQTSRAVRSPRPSCVTLSIREKL